MKYRFLTREQVDALQRRALVEHGGQEGVRDSGLIDAAIAMPQSSYGGQYLHGGLAEMAAEYLFHLCKNHGYLDGNKRVAFLAAQTFLLGHGYRFGSDDQGMEQLILRVASGELDKEALTEALAGIVAI